MDVSGGTGDAARAPARDERGHPLIPSRGKCAVPCHLLAYVSSPI